MKKEMINIVITLIFMSVVTVLFLVIISFFAYQFKWQSSLAMYGITFTYISSGLMGGLLFGKISEKRNIAMAFLFGIVQASLY
jgi:putative membrane protein (TIGR04086 family)